MIEIESVRVILLLSMLGIASYFDIKTRMVPDVIWLVFGGMGVILYVFDYQSVTSYYFLAMIMSGFVAFMIWRWRLAGTADIFAVLAITVILPVYYEFVMIPIVILVTVFLLVVVVIILFNISLNISDIIRLKKIDIFSKFTTELKIKKIFAFFVVHRKRKYEKFVIRAENQISIISNTKSFRFLPSRKKITRENYVESNGIFVQNIPPLILYMFGIAVFLFFM